MGYFDKEGYLYISGRIKEIINRGGEKISPKEVDEVFTSYKKVNKDVSFAVKHPKLGEDIAIAIVLNNNFKCTANELKSIALKQKYNVETALNFKEGLKKITKNKPKIICFMGSLYFIGSVLKEN